MAVRTVLLVVAVVALLAPNAFGADQWVMFDSDQEAGPTVSIVSSGFSELVLRIEVPGVLAEEIETDRGIFTRLSLPGYGQTPEIGEALLPTIREFVELPFGAHPTSNAPDYGIDVDHLKEYSGAAKGGWNEYAAKFIAVVGF